MKRPTWSRRITTWAITDMNTLPVPAIINNPPSQLGGVTLPTHGIIPGPPVLPPPTVLPSPESPPTNNVDFIDPAAIQNSLNLIVQPGQVFEVRALKCTPQGGGRSFTASGYFNSVEAAVPWIVSTDTQWRPACVYITLNPCNPSLLARAPNAIREYPEFTTGDGDIVARRWFFFDVDPKRPSGISSTDVEKGAAWDTVLKIRDYLERENGWTAPVVADSGNGYHLLYRADLPNDEATTRQIRAILGMLDKKFSNAGAQLDTAVFNAGRLARVYGTWTRKGTSLGDRPHRVSRILEVPPGGPVPVPQDAIARIVGGTAKGATPATNPGTRALPTPGSLEPRLDVEKYLAHVGVKFERKEKAEGLVVYGLEHCPFHPDHGGSETAILCYPESRPRFKCFHQRCEGKNLADVFQALGQPSAAHYEVPPPTEDMPENPDAPEVWYEHNASKYWILDERKDWVSVNEQGVRRHLAEAGYARKREEGEPLSAVERALNIIQRTRAVGYVGPLAGRFRGVYEESGQRLLITSSPRLIEPTAGDWPVLRTLVTGMLGEEQLPYFYGWSKTGVESLRSGQPRPGQVLVLTGPPNAFKSVLQNVITGYLGGRSGKPYAFFSGRSEFNGDLIGTEHLVLEDEMASNDIRARRNMGAQLKQIAACDTQRMHAKHQNALTLRPFWRCTISVNLEPENLLVLPVIDQSIEDKLILLKVTRIGPPMPASTGAERDKFWKTLMSELPAFVDFLMKWEIPEKLRSPRYGITHYHHPEILAAVSELSPENRLLSLIDRRVFAGTGLSVFEGPAEELERSLADGNTAYEARSLLSYTSACGVYLGRLAAKYPARVSSKLRRGQRIWSIRAPVSAAEDPNGVPELPRYGSPIPPPPVLPSPRLG